MEALTFGNRRELLSIARKRIGREPDRYIDHIYGEHEAGGTSWLYLSPAPFAEAGFDMNVPKQPIINFVKDFLAIVPMVLTIWPGLFAGIFLLSRHGKSAAERRESRTASTREVSDDENHVE